MQPRHIRGGHCSGVERNLGNLGEEAPCESTVPSGMPGYSTRGDSFQLELQRAPRDSATSEQVARTRYARERFSDGLQVCSM